MKSIDDHIAVPGPLYWDFRCLTCGGNVDDHVWMVTYLWRKIKKLFTRRKQTPS